MSNMSAPLKKKIAFVTDEGTKFSIEVDRFDSLIDVKEKIRQKRKFRIIDQSLSFNGEILPDDFNVYYATNINGPIRVNVDYFNVDRRDNGRIPDLSSPTLLEIAIKPSLKVKVDVRNTIAQLKTQIPLKIDSMATTPASRLILKHEGTELKDSSKTLEQCGIAADSVITVEVSQRELDLRINLPDSRYTTYLQVSPTDKVWQLKEKIKEQSEGKFATAGTLEIYLGGKVLADHRYLVDCEIPQTEQLTVQFHPSRPTYSSPKRSRFE